MLKMRKTAKEKQTPKKRTLFGCFSLSCSLPPTDAEWRFLFKPSELRDTLRRGGIGDEPADDDDNNVEDTPGASVTAVSIKLSRDCDFFRGLLGCLWADVVVVLFDAVDDDENVSPSSLSLT